MQLSVTVTKLRHIKCDHPVHIICSMSTIGRNARAQTFVKDIVALLIIVFGKSSQICCSAPGLWLWLKFVKCLKNHTPHMVVEWV